MYYVLGGILCKQPWLSAEIYEATVDPIDPPSSILLLLGSEKLPIGIRERPQLDSRHISRVNVMNAWSARIT